MSTASESAPRPERGRWRKRGEVAGWRNRLEGSKQLVLPPSSPSRGRARRTARRRPRSTLRPRAEWRRRRKSCGGKMEESSCPTPSASFGPGPRKERDIRADRGRDQGEALRSERLAGTCVGKPEGGRGVRAAAAEARGDRDLLGDAWTRQEGIDACRRRKEAERRPTMVSPKPSTISPRPGGARADRRGRFAGGLSRPFVEAVAAPGRLRARG